MARCCRYGSSFICTECCWRSASKLRVLPLRQEKPSRPSQLRGSFHQRRPPEYPQPTQQLFSCNRQVISWRLHQIDRSLQKRLGSTQRWWLGVCLVALLTHNYSTLHF